MRSRPAAPNLSASGLPVGLLAAAAFLSAAGARVIDPLLHVIASDFGATVPMVAIIITAFTLPYGLNQLILGPIGDKFGKLRVLLGALVAYAVATGACAFAGDLAQLTVLRAFAGAASGGLIPVALAYIGDAVPYDLRQLTLSRFLTGAVLAQVLAGPIGGMFGEYIGWRGVFVLLSALAVGVGAVLAWRIRGLPDRRSTLATFNSANYVRLLRKPLSRRLLLAGLVDGMVLGGAFPFIAPFLREAFDLSYGVIGLLLACFGVGAWIYTRFAGRIIRALAEPGMVGVGGLLMASGLALGTLLTVPWAFVGVEVMLGLGFMMLHGVLQARATEMLPEARATAVSSFVVMLFMGQSLGALAMGVLIAAFDYRLSFQINAMLVLGFTVWLRWLIVQALAERQT
jgi:predicted MFS family arabinose efflux permease